VCITALIYQTLATQIYIRDLALAVFGSAMALGSAMAPAAIYRTRYAALLPEPPRPACPAVAADPAADPAAHGRLSHAFAPAIARLSACFKDRA
jgi:hypothetical protein